MKLTTILLASLLALSCWADEKTQTNVPPLVEVAPGVFQIGLVRLDKNQRSVQFPAVLNQDHGLIEYLLVTTRGKTHESLLKTEAEPFHIHVAMLLLGAKGAAQSKEFLKVPMMLIHVIRPGATQNRLAELLKGDAIRIELAWNKVMESLFLFRLKIAS